MTDASSTDRPATARVTITVTAPPRDAAHHARTIADLIQAEYGDTMRLDIHVDGDRLITCQHCGGNGHVAGKPCPECAEKGLPPQLAVAATEATDRGYCPHCGRGDCAPTADQYEQLRQRAVAAETQLATIARIFDGLGNLLATSSRDWGAYRVDAWLYAVVLGWDCEQASHDDTCTHGAMEEMAIRFGWDEATVAKARRYRAAVRALPEPTP